MKKRKIIICRGIQGSGKSTWARQWVKESPKTRVRYNNDDIRNMLGPYWILEREPLVTKIKDDIINQFMSAGYDIVIDNMNLNPKEIEGIENIVAQHNEIWRDDATDFFYETEFKDFFISVEECIRRDSLRDHPIGEAIIRNTWNKYKNFILATNNKVYQNSLLKQDSNLPKAIIVDIDSTLSFNITGRPYYGKGCAEGIKDDIPNESVCNMVKSLFGEYAIIIVTGREGTKEVQVATEQWLKDHGIAYNEIYYRNEGDYSKGALHKKNIFETYIKDRYNVQFIIDDSKPCVDMYRDLGLVCLQPHEGNI